MWNAVARFVVSSHITNLVDYEVKSISCQCVGEDYDYEVKFTSYHCIWPIIWFFVRERSGGLENARTNFGPRAPTLVVLMNLILMNLVIGTVEIAFSFVLSLVVLCPDLSSPVLGFCLYPRQLLRQRRLFEMMETTTSTMSSVLASEANKSILGRETSHLDSFR
jgi:hypothetical protein